MQPNPCYIGSLIGENGSCVDFWIINRTLFTSVEKTKPEPVMSAIALLNNLSDSITQQAFQRGVDDKHVQDMIVLWETIAQNMYPFSSSTLVYQMGEKFYGGA